MQGSEAVVFVSNILVGDSLGARRGSPTWFFFLTATGKT